MNIFSKLLKDPPKAERYKIEDSILLRLTTTGMAITGIIAAAQLAESPLWLSSTSVTGCFLGAWLSYKRRYSSNFIAKIWISVGILVVAGMFFNELLSRVASNVADARVPLTEMLMALMALHSFDLPRRRDLSLSAVVGLVLITSASTLSRDLTFFVYLSVFLLLALFMFQLDCASRTLSKVAVSQAGSANLDHLSSAAAARTSRTISGVANLAADKLLTGADAARGKIVTRLALVTLLSIATTLGCFILLPRVQFNSIKQFRFGSGTGASFVGKFSMPSMQPGLMSPDGSIKSQPNAYFGFAESLDTNYRGKLGDQIVMRVAGQNGTYLRAMAYDTFDGKSWKMSRPKETTDCLVSSGNSFSIHQKYSYYSSVRYREIYQTFYVEEDSCNLVVCASIPMQVFFPSAKLQIDNYGAIRSPVGIQKDMVYTVVSNVPMHNFATLRQKGPLSEERDEKLKNQFRNYLQLPKIDPAVRSLSAKVAGKGGSYARAENLCNHLLANYKYDLDVPTTSKDIDSVSDFILNVKRGYCEHFASALVVMCRTQGIPARLVTGYCPGEFNPFTGLWEVRLHDAHSWTEVFINGAGWVALDSTPGSMGAGMQLENPNSIFSFLESQIDLNWKKFVESAEGKRFEREASKLINRISGGALSLSTLLPLLLKIGVLAAVLTTAYWLKRAVLGSALSSIFSKLKKRKDQTERPTIHAMEASQEYLLVLDALSNLGVKKQPGDTASDILIKSASEFQGSDAEEQNLLESCREFLDLYAEVRFGSVDELPRLRELSQIVRDRAEKLADQRRSASIS